MIAVRRSIEACGVWYGKKASSVQKGVGVRVKSWRKTELSWSESEELEKDRIELEWE
jgi:hypothetical protein